VPISIQHGRSASHTLRIVCPNGHLGFAPIKTGSFRVGCDCEPDSTVAVMIAGVSSARRLQKTQARDRAFEPLHSRRLRALVAPAFEAQLANDRQGGFIPAARSVESTSAIDRQGRACDKGGLRTGEK
jgi:hypothetical protein